jgi:2-methylisocitrate lyase-like PEP mutase family enzyme
MSMRTKADIFRELHNGEEPLLIGNVWNVQSAKIFEKAGFKAIATSSAAVAETLGYSDGENMPFDEYAFVIRRLVAGTTLPLSADIEGGYGREASEVVENIVTLSKAGVVGINIEDSVVSKGKRTIVDRLQFATLIESVCLELRERNIDVFVNVRSDAFLLRLPNAIEETIKRIDAYQSTGADGLFFPCVTVPEEIKALTTHTKLPVNVMCMPELPGFAELKAMGVKRISMGNFFNARIYDQLDKLITETMKSGNFKPVFA